MRVITNYSSCSLNFIVSVIEEQYTYVPILGARGDKPYTGHASTVVQNSFDGFENSDAN